MVSNDTEQATIRFENLPSDPNEQEVFVEALSSILDGFKQSWAIGDVPHSVVVVIIRFLLASLKWNTRLMYKGIVVETATKIRFPECSCKAAIDMVINKSLLAQNGNAFGIEFIFDHIPDGSRKALWIGFAQADKIENNEKMQQHICNDPKSLYDNGFFGLTVCAKGRGKKSSMWIAKGGGWGQCIEIGEVETTDSYGLLFVYSENNMDVDLYINNKARKGSLCSSLQFALPEEFIVFAAVEESTQIEIRRLELLR